MHRDIDVLNDEMVAAGVRIFVGGLHPASSAKSLRKEQDGEVHLTDGPYLKTTEHVGGFWVLEASDMNEAIEWGRKAAIACRAPVEVRPFHWYPGKGSTLNLPYGTNPRAARGPESAIPPGFGEKPGRWRRLSKAARGCFACCTDATACQTPNVNR